jgi:GNAT superfamily N-acetyltransferase
MNIPSFIAACEFWGRDPDGSIAAQAFTYWRKTEENRHLAWAEIRVRPDRRRRGIAKALLDVLADIIDDDGRTLLMTSTSERVPSGTAFAERVGADAVFNMHINRLVLAGVDREMLRSWIADGPRRAAGYALVANDGDYPDDLVSDVVGVFDIMNTAPREDMNMEDTRFTVEHLRELERSRNAAGTERWSLFARHEASGALVGFTEVYWNPSEPETVFQGDTGVNPSHRGHALGKWLKAAMLERIFEERQGVVDVRTGNADSNDAMLGINDAIGFERYIAQTNWQVSTERVKAYLAGSST